MEPPKKFVESFTFFFKLVWLLYKCALLKKTSIVESPPSKICKKPFVQVEEPNGLFGIKGNQTVEVYGSDCRSVPSLRKPLLLSPHHLKFANKLIFNHEKEEMRSIVRGRGTKWPLWVQTASKYRGLQFK